MTKSNLQVSINDAIALTDEFNIACGNKLSETVDANFNAIKNQSLRVLEEIKETIIACEGGNKLEILDGIADVLVTAIGLATMVHDTVGDVGKSLLAVCNNNSLKYTSCPATAFEWLEWASTTYNVNGTEEKYFTNSSVHEGIEYFSTRRSSDGKIMKNRHHPKVRLEEFIY